MIGTSGRRSTVAAEATNRRGRGTPDGARGLDWSAVERLDLLVLALDCLVAGAAGAAATRTAARCGARRLALGLFGAIGTARAVRAVRAVARARRGGLVRGGRHALERLGQGVHH